jgi:hypothetical protein
VGIFLPHHMWYSMRNVVTWIQYKHYCWDQLGPTQGYKCLSRMLVHPGKSSLTFLREAYPRELKALADFIAYKEYVLQHLQYVECKLQAIEDIHWLQTYLKDFPQANRIKATARHLAGHVSMLQYNNGANKRNTWTTKSTNQKQYIENRRSNERSNIGIVIKSYTMRVFWTKEVEAIQCSSEEGTSNEG